MFRVPLVFDSVSRMSRDAKEIKDLRQRTKEGTREAKTKDSQVGRAEGENQEGKGYAS